MYIYICIYSQKISCILFYCFGFLLNTKILSMSVKVSASICHRMCLWSFQDSEMEIRFTIFRPCQGYSLKINPKDRPCTFLVPPI